MAAPLAASTVEDNAADVEIIEGDIRSYERAYRAVKGIEIVFHQAAPFSVQIRARSFDNKRRQYHGHSKHSSGCP